MLSALLWLACRDKPPPSSETAAPEPPPVALHDVTDSTRLGDCFDLTALALGDFDGDRDDDLAMGCGAYEPPRLFGNVDARMGDLTHTLLTETGPEWSDRRGLAFGQADADSALELFVTTGGGFDQLYDWDGEKWSDIAESLGITDTDGVGTFGAWLDADADGDEDLLVGHRAEAGDRNLLWENGGWTNIAGGLADLSQEFSGALSADWDEDGDPDLLTTARCAGSDRVCADDAGGTMRFYRKDAEFFGESCAGSEDVTTLATADLNGDGHADLALGRWGAGVSIRLNPGDGQSPCDWTEQPLGPERALTTAVVLLDLDNDGDADLFAAHHNPDTFSPQSWRLNAGDGTFTAIDPIAPAWEQNERVMAAPLDIDGDGWMDLLLTTEAGLPPQRAHLLRNVQGDDGSPYGALTLRGVPAGSRVLIDGATVAHAVAGGGWRVDLSDALHVGLRGADAVDLAIALPNGASVEASGVGPGCYALASGALEGC